MLTVGIICEYNPLHLGHSKQLSLARRYFGEDTAIVCLMSGNYVQRGSPAILDKSLRAAAAIHSGADLVLELPVTCALSSAEGFARGGVEILGSFCDHLCFGAETADPALLMNTAKMLLSDAFPPALRNHLDTGKSFPAARAAALEELGLTGAPVASPNDILAVEYCKAILSVGSKMKPFPILREGSYHDELPDKENPSATALRKLMLSGQSWEGYVPASAFFRNAPLHTTAAGERAILMKLRTLTDEEFESLPYGSEGLWRKFMHACRSCSTLEEIIAATKSKRYTRTRIDRMVMCAFLGVTREMLDSAPPYSRILAFNDRGRSVLKQMKKHTVCLNAGEDSRHPYQDLEKRCGDLYGLFCTDGPEPPGAEEARRIYYRNCL